MMDSDEDGDLEFLYKYRPGRDFLESLLVEHSLWAAAPQSLNDPFEHETGSYSGQARLRRFLVGDEPEQLGVISLTSDPTNTLLWTHYGNEHKGFCLEYRRSSLPPSVTSQLHPIRYSSVRRSLLRPSDGLLRKSSPWSYEREWRVLSPETDVLVPGFKPHGVVFGLRCSEEPSLEEEVRKLIPTDAGVRFGYVRQRDRSYDLRVEWEERDKA